MKIQNYLQIVSLYENATKEMENTFSKEQLEVITSVIKNEVMTPEQVEEWMHPFLSTNTLQLIIEAHTAGFSDSQIKEIANPLLSDDEALVVLRYHSLMNNNISMDTTKPVDTELTAGNQVCSEATAE